MASTADKPKKTKAKKVGAKAAQKAAITLIQGQKPLEEDNDPPDYSDDDDDLDDENSEYEKAKRLVAKEDLKRAKRNPSGGGNGGDPPDPVDPANVIDGVNNGHPMTREQLAWHKILVEIKFDSDTADELMRQGIDSTEWAGKQEKLHHVLKGVSANKSPKCPDKSKIFMRADSQANLSTVCEWVKIRNFCSISSSATWWDKNSLKETEHRLAEITAFEVAAKKDTVTAPKIFKDMLLWEDFSDSLLSYASIVRGAASIPLLYLLREITGHGKVRYH